MSSNLIERVAERCCNPSFEKVFEEFARENAHKFADAAETKVGEDVEHKHEYVDEHHPSYEYRILRLCRYQACHEQYLKIFEGEISGKHKDLHLYYVIVNVEDLVQEEGGTIEEFFEQCSEAAHGEYTALFEEHRYAWFVKHLLASMEYKHFYGLMVNEARRYLRK